MRIIDRYICREIVSHALVGLTIFTFVFFVPQLVKLMELVVRHSNSTSDVALLFLSTFPGVFTFTLPIAVLVGVMIGLGRLSADSELIAMSASGIGLRRLLVPVGVLALGTTGLTLAMTLWLGPAAMRTFRGLQERMISTQASFQVQPRVFDERFPRLVLYIEDVAAAGTRWRGVFLADSNGESGSRLTLAEEAIVIAEREQGKLQIHLSNGSTHELSIKEPDRYSVTTFGESDWPVEIKDTSAARAVQTTPQERSLSWLAAERGPRWREARVELYRRFAFPAACLVFALLAVPLGARPRRGGRAIGFLVTVVLVCGYYLVFVSGTGLARAGTLPPSIGVWTANLLTGLIGLVLLPRMERTGGGDPLARIADALTFWRHEPAPANGAAAAAEANGSKQKSRPLGGPARIGRMRFPLLIDLYVLRSFLFYFSVILVSFLFLVETFTFFELLDDIARHRTPFFTVVDYFLYLAPGLLYQLAPLAALVGVLVTLGLLAKNNEIVAFKAAGVSLYRLAMPLFALGLALAGGLLLMDETYLPYANQRQDALRNQIKGRPAQTFFQPRRRWIFGENDKIYNYELFDADKRLFGGLNVVELDPATFQMRRRVFAGRAFWDDTRRRWQLESGWVRDFSGSNVDRYIPFRHIELAELTEPPSYFNREVRQSYQMNWRELQQYIAELRQAGFDVARLTVQWHKKLAYPLIAPVIMLLAVPFAFLVGTRGAVGGVALGVAIAIVYWAIAALFEAMGAVGQLPPLLAGWTPDVIFVFVGIYFFLKMPT
jgi:LPS export ABC transporter permease LptF/LPS export ABC transporter permease LptG